MRPRISLLQSRHRHLCTSRPLQSSWSAAVSHAAKLVDLDETPDPLSLVAPHMALLTSNIHALLGSRNATLDQVAKYYIRDDGAKRLRPLLVLLMARTIHPSSSSSHSSSSSSSSSSTSSTSTSASLGSISIKSQRAGQGEVNVNEALSRGDILNDINPSTSSLHSPTRHERNDGINEKQARLAEITEMIHAASLLHDDVIDGSSTRRGRESCHAAFSPKMAVLAGDYMLGRASVALARLRHPEVIELLATVIANLVEGEFMQLRNTIDAGHESTMAYYLEKTYLKTASLIAKSCRASAILGHAKEAHVEAAYTFGRNLGLAFQVVDDMLDYSASAADLGKPNNADLKLGLATAPVLYAWRQHPELGEMIKRKFSQDGDIDLARRLALNSDGLERTRELAERYCVDALNALAQLPTGESRDALEGITHQVLTRTR